VVSAISVLSVGFGAVFARLSDRFPTRTALFETIAGILLIGGFSAIGCVLPFV